MAKKSPNLLQKIARKAIREIIDEVNTKKQSKSAKNASAKSGVGSFKSKIKRSRYIPANEIIAIGSIIIIF